ncbi:glutaredoxin 3 [Sulfurivirga sp.]|uniref:glutaredoxin 3 n=1 Tax=Sulfurivirga sp. TaxID=2614236 RepID=UPI0025FD188E|nr:glutaredoxin 3 [Sulfurivirga sp.]
MPKVVVYATQTCPYCTMARRLLESKGVDYELIDVGRDRALWQEMEARSGRSTVPQIFIGETHVGGCDDLHALEAQGKLDELLKGA